MKKRIFLASLLFLGIGVFDRANVDFRVVAAEPIASFQTTSFAPGGAVSGVRSLLADTRDLCDVAIRSFSPSYCAEKFDAETSAKLRTYFQEICVNFQTEILSLSETDDSEAFESATFALQEMKYCQPNSPAVAKLEDRICEIFSGDNVQLEIGESILAASTRRAILENFAVNETIRGTRASGSGSLNGATTLDVRPNPNQAEFQIILNADVATRTVGVNRGVQVYSDNFGKIVAAKPIFWSDSGLRTTPSVANGAMKSRVNNINTNFITLFNGAIVQNKVAQELPYTERESALRMSSRVASELDAEANRALVSFNKRWSDARKATAEKDRLIRKTTSKSDDDRAYFSFVVGKSDQPTSLNADFKPATVAGRGVVRSKTSKRYASLAGNAEKRPDVVFRAHQSAPNNAAFVALNGLTIGGEGSFDAVVERFPGVGSDEIAAFLAGYFPKNDAPANGEKTVDVENVVYRFAEERPFAVSFADGKIETTLRFASVQTDGREWNDLEIKLVYNVVEKNGGVAFQRDAVDVLPGGLAPDAPIPARFQAFRSVVMKRLEKGILDEYAMEGAPIRDVSTGELKGTLVPVAASAQDGWFEISFNYKENVKK